MNVEINDQRGCGETFEDKQSAVLCSVFKEQALFDKVVSFQYLRIEMITVDCRERKLELQSTSVSTYMNT